MTLIRGDLSMERVANGLPDVITEIPERLLSALETKTIKQSDLAPNIAAIVASNHPSQTEPPLNIHEQVARTLLINTLAANCVNEFLNNQ